MRFPTAGVFSKMDLEAPLPPRSVVWIRSESLLERSCPSGSPLLPSRPQHPSDLVATPLLEDGGGGGEGSVTLPPSGPVRYTSTWELGEVEESSEDGYTIKFGTSFPTGRASLKRTVGRHEVYVANPARLDGIPDMSRLSDLSQPCLLYNLLVRYRCDAIYTFTGPLLISINPFKRIDDIYSNEVMSTYFGSNLTNMEPHVFCAAESARQGLIREGKSQSIVISGESGSGKTEAAKYILSYLARSVSSSSSSSSSSSGGAGHKGGGIEEHILQTNPITEALGNAKTMRNSNSSRFGKFVRVRFGYGGATMHSAFIDHYLLEKPRVTHQPEGERNYHAFYQLCGGAGEALRAQLGIGAAADHRYTSQSGCTEVDGVDDEADFEELVGAMRGMGMSTEDEMSIMRTLAGILHLGDVSFSSAKDGSGQLETGSSAEWAGKLLGLQVEDMRTAICTRSIKAGLDTLSVPKSKDEALSSRDAVARVVYTKMFEWVITAINSKLGKTGGGSASAPPTANSASNTGFGSASDTFIGLLDIFGFEVMDRNGFEQLCINYANEKLQLFFNDRMLHLEQRAYQEEGVEWEFVDFTDNASVLSTLEGRPSGLLPTLDDQCLFATSTDASFLQVLSKSHATSAEITFPKIKQAAFVVRHSAGPVEYDISGFLEKNKDMLFSDLTSMMSSSSNAFIAALFEELPAPPPASGRTPTRGQGGKASQHVSVSAKFRHQLGGLMRSLEQTNPLFVRCIKPNHDKSPAYLDGQLVDHQLRCSGVLAAVKISQCGFPSRVPFTEFSTRYMPLLSKAPASGTDRKQVCATLLEQLGVADSDFQMGRTRIFFKAGVIASLEQTLSNAVSDSAALLQAHVRSSSSMHLFDMRCAARALQGGSKRRKARSEYIAEVERHRALSTLQASCRGMIYFGRILGMHRSAILIQKIVKGRQTRRRVADAQARQRALQDRFASQSSPQASPSPSPAKPGARAHFDASKVASSPATKAPLPAKGNVAGPPPPPRSQGPSLSAILSACQDVGVQATCADEEEGGGYMDGEAGGGRAGDFLVLPGGERVSAHDVLLMRDENRKLQVVLELSRRNPDTPFTSPAPAKTLKNLGGLLGGPSPAKSDVPMSPIDRLAHMPAEKELECEHIMSKMRLNMREFANVMDVARIGLRQGEELCKANAELESLRAEVLKLRGEKQAYSQMQEVVMIQTAQLAEMAEAKRELEDRLLEGNMRRVSIEEALDNMKHWQEVNQEKHRRNEERLAELEPEHEDATSQLVQFKVRVAEMDSANCVLAAELNRLRKVISEQGGPAAAAAAAGGCGNGGSKFDGGAAAATPRSAGTFLGSMGIPSPFRSTPREGTPPSSS